jgi:hypothetical protein
MMSHSLTLSECQAPHSFEHKTTAGLPQYLLDNPLREASLLISVHISLRLICPVQVSFPFCTIGQHTTRLARHDRQVPRESRWDRYRRMQLAPARRPVRPLFFQGMYTGSRTHTDTQLLARSKQARTHAGRQGPRWRLAPRRHPQLRTTSTSHPQLRT